MSIKHKNVAKQSEYATSVYSPLFFRGGGRGGGGYIFP